MHNINVSIVYARPEKQWLKQFTVARGTLAKELFELSGFRDAIQELKEVSADELPMGIYSQKVTGDYLLENNDRLEIYRPLLADPKQVRRQLAKLGKTMGKKI